MLAVTPIGRDALVIEIPTVDRTGLLALALLLAVVVGVLLWRRA